MSITGGAPPFVTLASYPLTGIAAPQVEVKRREVKTVIEAGQLAQREHLAVRDPGYPVRTVKFQFTVRYSHLRDREELIEGILAGPGPHELCLWKPHHQRWTCDGARAEFFFDRPVAIDTLTPGGLSIDLFAPIVRVGLTATPLTYTVVSEGTYAAGSPAEGLVWFVLGARKFKLPTAPAAGAELTAALVHTFDVLETGDVDKRYSSVLREPRDLVLVEV